MPAFGRLVYAGHLFPPNGERLKRTWDTNLKKQAQRGKRTYLAYIHSKLEFCSVLVSIVCSLCISNLSQAVLRFHHNRHDIRTTATKPTAKSMSLIITGMVCLTAQLE